MVNSVKLTKSLLIAISTLYAFSTSAQVDLETNQKALNMIRDFATNLCDSIRAQGHTQNVDLSGKAKAELKGVVKKVADLGIEGAAKYQSSDYEGVLQADLAKLLSNQANCKLEVWRDLKDKLISSSVVSPSKGPGQGPAPVSAGSGGASIAIDAPLGSGANANGVGNFSLKLLRLQSQPNGTVKAYFLHTSKEVGYTLGLYRPESMVYFVDNEGKEYRAISSEGIATAPPDDGPYIGSQEVDKLSGFPKDIGKQYVLTFPAFARKPESLHFYAAYYGKTDRGCCFVYKASIKNIRVL